MTSARIIRAEYSDFRMVKTRKVLQLVFEVPIEQASDALNKLGFPNPSDSVWCAVAVLDEKASAPVAQLDEHRSSNPADAGSSPAGCAKPRRPFHELPLSQQCAIRCSDKQFQKYIGVESDEEAAEVVRDVWLHVESRSVLDANSVAAGRWSRLEAQFKRWLTEQEHGALVR